MIPLRKLLIHGLWLLALGATLAGPARASAPELKIAALKFGTVNWVMDVIKHHGLDRQNGFTLKTLGLASKNATTVAFLSGEVDGFVTDWFWVLRERARGSDIVQIPYSASLGAVMVAKNSKIASLDDLAGTKIGVAGGPIDKSWLLLRAHQLKRGQGDLAQTASPIFAAPPLLNQQLVSARADAVLNFWHFSARLEGAGYTRLASVSELMSALGIPVAVPLVGFVFPTSLDAAKPGIVANFARALKGASAILKTSDGEWERLRPLMRTKSDGEFATLKKRYREGILNEWTEGHRTAAKAMFEVLKEIGGDKLTGAGTRFDPAMFWSSP
ncbi:MAG: ABC transporter substrate-binding protein [Rhizobiales bacterium]|nr:ABC transporter substrate-binding protein [Hyphomicrobiales bacterium]